MGALNAWQAESQLASATQQAESDVGIVPMQTSLLLECGLTAQLQHIPQVMRCYNVTGLFCKQHLQFSPFMCGATSQQAIV